MGHRAPTQFHFHIFYLKRRDKYVKISNLFRISAPKRGTTYVPWPRGSNEPLSLLIKCKKSSYLLFLMLLFSSLLLPLRLLDPTYSICVFMLYLFSRKRIHKWINGPRDHMLSSTLHRWQANLSDRTIAERQSVEASTTSSLAKLKWQKKILVAIASNNAL